MTRSTRKERALLRPRAVFGLSGSCDGRAAIARLLNPRYGETLVLVPDDVARGPAHACAGVVLTDTPPRAHSQWIDAALSGRDGPHVLLVSRDGTMSPRASECLHWLSVITAPCDAVEVERFATEAVTFHHVRRVAGVVVAQRASRLVRERRLPIESAETLALAVEGQKRESMSVSLGISVAGATRRITTLLGRLDGVHSLDALRISLLR